MAIQTARMGSAFGIHLVQLLDPATKILVR
jgi:hypothetical protein